MLYWYRVQSLRALLIFPALPASQDRFNRRIRNPLASKLPMRPEVLAWAHERKETRTPVPSSRSLGDPFLRRGTRSLCCPRSRSKYFWASKCRLPTCSKLFILFAPG